ncbi:hypothetical protein RhiirA5_438069 [Rhizophagus irregularis]|uniref:Uncharacterized protein n=1 Tax=Rhizophagus irregularis TaxID=588596 RepID=A0A2N0NJM1_9GLOM|nr:hypothetical protein RhiirA5_438069 [Rhizophagus irregularis]
MNKLSVERIHNCSIMMDGLIVNEFNLFWNKLLITGEFREWTKLKTMNKSLYFVSNLNKYSKRQTDDQDSFERAYKIKNLLKELPKYAILFKRDVNMIDSEVCIRCEKEVEIWICETNEFTIREVILSAIVSYEEQMLERGDIDQAAQQLYEI